MKYKIIIFFILFGFLASCGEKTCPTYMTLAEMNAIAMENFEREQSGKKSKKRKKDKWGRIKKKKKWSEPK
ncbi:MAG: hypothetical protein EAZ97_12660 [Bacteroidetes bacterium]|nr:MAG: hypothetical protein EAZ97_12660 [Bacteroidota bacterium]